MSALSLHRVYRLSDIILLADPGHDHHALSTILTFKECDMSHCIQVILIDDMMVEQPEDFHVTLQRTPELSEQIQLDIQRKRVTILERDSELVGTGREGMVCLKLGLERL